ncbi:MAG: crossover junction endodeoxyribonuclease RuvC [Bacillota bacterium]|nr:crossover junction endodeoxyribonuclease RuvC [Bacillota bacterium]MDW7728782.1 crossover junction endodeoxyribonuclease RuvC [Bacillota bacterium]
MRLLGIDPGVAITGYSIVEEKKSDFHLIASGCIRTKSDLPPEQRLEAIYDRVSELILEYKPQVLAIEKIFFSKNVRTAFQVGEARGVVILAASKTGLALFEYTPLQVKQAVAGYGKAEKGQVQRMVQMLLRLAEMPAVDDEADAMAVALCHLQTRRYQDAVKGGRS